MRTKPRISPMPVKPPRMLALGLEPGRPPREASPLGHVRMFLLPSLDERGLEALRKLPEFQALPKELQDQAPKSLERAILRKQLLDSGPALR